LRVPLMLVGFAHIELVRAGSGDVDENQPGMSATAADSAVRARPCGVACAWSSSVSTVPKFWSGSPMFTY